MQAVTLDDKYVSDHGRIYLTGIQALVRLALVQRRRDLRRRPQHRRLHLRLSRLAARRTRRGAVEGAASISTRITSSSSPGINEELAATAVWGTQQVHLIGESDYDGVFAMWYGKGPGVDRCGDVFKHMNFAGTSRHGGVLLVAGDDHGAYSSTLPHQSDHLFSASMIPVLYPCNVQEYLELGLHGWAMSRFSGCAVASRRWPTRSSRRLRSRPIRSASRSLLPEDFVMPEGGLNCRLSERLRRRAGAQAGSADAGLQDLRGAGLRARQPAQPHDDRLAQRAARHHRLGQVLHGRARSAGGARHHRAATPRRSAFACSRCRCPGRWSRTACASSRAAWTRSWWSKKSARWSSTSSRSSSTTGAPTCARA